MIDAFVLAGGRSSRMGVDKARLAWDGRPMAVHVARIVAGRGGRVALVRRRVDDLPWPDVEVVEEAAHPNHHPLHGVVTALSHARTPLVLLVPCDVPWIDARVLDALLPGPAVATSGGGLHPLLAVVPRSLLQHAERLLEGEAPARLLVEGMPRVEVPEDAVRNVNRPRDRPGRGPVARLLDGLPWLDDTGRARVEAGERARLASRGMVDLRYPPDPSEQEVG